MAKKIPNVLTIAGSDSSGGAGIQADLKTFAANGCYGASVITAITAQNTTGVQHVYPLPKIVLERQLESVFSDLNFKAIKIGMLFNKEIITTVQKLLKKYPHSNIVLDPVMISKSGSVLLKPNAVEALKKLFSACDLITPNLDEAEHLLKRKINTKKNMEAAAEELAKSYKTNVLLKGGHLPGKISADFLYCHAKNETYWLEAEKIKTKNTHGTGCTLSAAIAAFLAQQYSLVEAVLAAKHYLLHALMAGKDLKVGTGFGPLNHLFTTE